MFKSLRNLPVSAVAVLLGVSLVFTHSAFKVDKSNRVDYTFHYTGPSTMDVDDVEDVANWSYDETAECPLGDNRACTISIGENYVDNEPSNPTLNSSAAISATLTGSGKAIVSSTADGEISNRSN